MYSGTNGSDDLFKLNNIKEPYMQIQKTRNKMFYTNYSVRRA